MDIIIESPKNSREKYKYDEEHKLFRLHKVLPAALVFPFPFGFIPGTIGEDGDPLDVFALGEFDGFPGCLMDVRIAGCITVSQSKNGKMIRNDRFLVIPEQSELFAHVNSLAEIPHSIITTLEIFLTTYMKLEGKQVKLLGNLDAAASLELINEGKK